MGMIWAPAAMSSTIDASSRFDGPPGSLARLDTAAREP